jgi:integrase
MTLDLIKPFDERLSVDKNLPDVARQILESVRTESTRKVYRRDWQRFCEWARANNRIEYPITSITLGAYLVWMHASNYSKSVIRRTVTVIKLAHDARDDPTGDRDIRAILNGIMRKDKRPTKKAKPIMFAELQAICEALTSNNNPRNIRDRALLSLGWIGALRASELVGLNWTDISESTQGFEINLRETKTNKTSESEMVAIPYLAHEYFLICPVRNLRALVPTSQVDFDFNFDRPIFTRTARFDGARMSERTIERALERACGLAGLNKRFTSHSLRRGFATFAAARGIDHHALMAHGRWKSAQVAEGYIERARLWTNNPIGQLLGSKSESDI